MYVLRTKRFQLQISPPNLYQIITFRFTTLINFVYIFFLLLNCEASMNKLSNKKEKPKPALESPKLLPPHILKEKKSTRIERLPFYFLTLPHF